MEGLEKQNGLIEQTVKSLMWYGSHLPINDISWSMVGESVQRAVDPFKSNIVFETDQNLTKQWKQLKP